VADITPPRGRTGARALVSGLVVVSLFASGLVAVALASRSARKSRLPSLTGHLHLAHRRVQAGRTVDGRIVFQNRTSRAKVLMRGCEIDGLYAIGVRSSNGRVQAPAFSDVGCSPEQALIAKPGTTVYRFTLRLDYTACSQSAKDQPPRDSKYWTPPCLKDSGGERDIMPPLPAGRYTALFFPAGKWHGPHVKPAGVTVIKR
jgi:hypothetical protein